MVPCRTKVPNLHRHGERRGHAVNSLLGGTHPPTRQSGGVRPTTGEKSHRGLVDGDARHPSGESAGAVRSIPPPGSRPDFLPTSWRTRPLGSATAFQERSSVNIVVVASDGPKATNSFFQRRSSNPGNHESLLASQSENCWVCTAGGCPQPLCSPFPAPARPQHSWSLVRKTLWPYRQSFSQLGGLKRGQCRAHRGVDDDDNELQSLGCHGFPCYTYPYPRAA